MGIWKVWTENANDHKIMNMHVSIKILIKSTHKINELRHFLSCHHYCVWHKFQLCYSVMGSTCLSYHWLPVVIIRPIINSLLKVVMCKLFLIFKDFFFKNFKILTYYSHIWYQYEKCIKMSTSKPMFGLVVLEIASVI